MPQRKAKKRPLRYATDVTERLQRLLFTKLPAKGEGIVLSAEDWKARRWPAVSLLTDLRGSREEFNANACISGGYEGYRTTRDPVAMMQAFSAAIEIGVYPPVGILRGVADAFSRYAEGEGAVSLDQAFNGTKQGVWSPFTKRRKHALQRFVATKLYQAKIALGCSLETAAEKVQLALEHHRQLGISYSADTLIKKYSSWKDEFELDEADKTFFDHPDNPRGPWGDRQRKRFLAPPDFSLF